MLDYSSDVEIITRVNSKGEWKAHAVTSAHRGKSYAIITGTGKTRDEALEDLHKISSQEVEEHLLEHPLQHGRPRVRRRSKRGLCSPER